MRVGYLNGFVDSSLNALGKAMILKLPDSIVENPVILKDQFFDLKGLAVYSALSVSTLRNYIRSSGLPAYEIHGKILVKRSEFDKWVSGYRVNRGEDLNALANEVLKEIGLSSRGSKSVST